MAPTSLPIGGPVAGLGSSEMPTPSSSIGQRSPKRSPLYASLVDNSDSMRQALTQCPVLLMRHRKTIATASPSLRGDEASRTSGNASPAVASCLNSGFHPAPRQPQPQSPQQSFRGEARTFASRARSASPPQSEVSSFFCSEPKRASSPEERNTKLRGAGGANFRRNIASAGIPWRQIPNLDRPTAPEPRGGQGAERLLKAGQFSPKLSSGEGMREILTTSVEGSLFKTPPPSDMPPAVSSDVAKRRADGKLSPAAGFRELDFTGSEHGGADAARAEKSGGKASLHFAYRQQKKGVSHDLVSTKESCPYAREDASRAKEEPTSPTSPTSPSRPAASPQANLVGAGAVPRTKVEEEISIEPEKVQETRRDWQAPSARKSMPTRFYSDGRHGFSPHLSPRTLLAIQNPIHSIRQRATLPGVKLWK